MKAKIKRFVTRFVAAFLLLSFAPVVARAEGFEPSGVDDYIGITMSAFTFSFEYQGRTYPLMPLSASDQSLFELLNAYEPISSRVKWAESTLRSSNGTALAGLVLALAGIAFSSFAGLEEINYVAIGVIVIGEGLILFSSIQASTGMGELLSAVSEWNQRAWSSR